MKHLLGMIFAVSLASHLSGAVLTYNVTVDTSGISPKPLSGEIAFDFGDNFGAVGANTAVISNFSPMAQLGAVDPTNSIGSYSGSLNSTLTLNSTFSSTLFAQNFTYTASPISFRLQLTTAAGGTAPSSFDLALINQSGAGLLTDDPGNVLTITIDTNGNATTTTYNTQTGAPSPVTVTAVGAVPEPASYSLLAAGLGAIAFFRRKR